MRGEQQKEAWKKWQQQSSESAIVNQIKDMHRYIIKKWIREENREEGRSLEKMITQLHTKESWKKDKNDCEFCWFKKGEKKRRDRTHEAE